MWTRRFLEVLILAILTNTSLVCADVAVNAVPNETMTIGLGGNASSSQIAHDETVVVNTIEDYRFCSDPNVSLSGASLVNATITNYTATIEISGITAPTTLDVDGTLCRGEGEGTPPTFAVNTATVDLVVDGTGEGEETCDENGGSVGVLMVLGQGSIACSISTSGAPEGGTVTVTCSDSYRIGLYETPLVSSNSLTFPAGGGTFNFWALTPPSSTGPHVGNIVATYSDGGVEGVVKDVVCVTTIGKFHAMVTEDNSPIATGTESTEQSKIVGEKVSVSGSLFPDGGFPAPEPPILQHTWQIDGKVVKGYLISHEKGEVTNLTAADTTNNQVGFYWVDGGKKDVSYNAVTQFLTYNTVAKYDVYSPTISMTSTTTQLVPKIRITQNGLFGFGDISVPPGHANVASPDGISIKASIDKESGIAGKFGMIQILKIDNSWINKWSITGSDGTNGKFVLDNGTMNQFYEHATLVDIATKQSLILLDSPTVKQGVYTLQVTNTDTFKTYGMFKPDVADSIYVPLAITNWNWFASGFRDSVYHNWTLTGTGSINPTGSFSNDFPEWEGSVVGLGIVPDTNGPAEPNAN